MRKALFSPLLAVIACLMMAATPALAQTVVSSPVSGNGTDGNEHCASGTYATNRSESIIAVDPTNSKHMLGLSKFFFSSPSSSGTDWSSVYRFHLGSYDFSGSAALALNFNNLQNEIAVNKRPAGSKDWSSPVVVDQFTSNSGLGQEYDKQWIAADWTGKTGNVYVAFTIFSLVSGQVYFARSTDGGQTWGAASCANDPSTQGDATDQFQPTVAADAQGHVAAAWYDQPAGRRLLHQSRRLQLLHPDRPAVVQRQRECRQSFRFQQAVRSHLGPPGAG